jgi:branched-chain amino acid transport system permease protein
MTRTLGLKSVKKKMLYILIAIVLLSIIPLVAQEITAYLILLFMYVTLSTSWNLQGGYLGDLSFGHATFFGIGAYTSALLVYYQVSPYAPINIVLGGILSACFAWLVGYPFLRLKGFYFAIGTLALGEICRLVFKDILSPITHGASGIGIQPLKPYSVFPYYYGILILMVITILLAYIIVNSRLGLTFLAIKNDPEAAAMLGINVPIYRILGFSFSALFVGLVGGFFAYYNCYVHPDGVFSSIISFEMIVMVFFGGAGTILGPIIGAVAVFLAEEIGRIVLGQGFLLLLAVMLVVVFIIMPGGIISLLTKRASIKTAFQRRKKVNVT